MLSDLVRFKNRVEGMGLAMLNFAYNTPGCEVKYLFIAREYGKEALKIKSSEIRPEERRKVRRNLATIDKAIEIAAEELSL